jgi:hypothetical protein
VEKELMTSLQQAELQGIVWRAVEEFRHRHGLSASAIFNSLASFAWGYLKRTGVTSTEIENRMRSHCHANELAYQRAVGPALPFDMPVKR